ncbi:MAG: hypothetical protein EOP10_35150, partial [Proteobacteria bacterium]
IPKAKAAENPSKKVEIERSPLAEAPIPSPVTGKKIVAVTACPTGIAHTFMAAEALKNQARIMGHEIYVETQGSVGAKSLLTREQIAEADAVIIAADTAVDLARFADKRIYRTDTSTALKKAAAVIEAALDPALAPETVVDSPLRSTGGTKEKKSGPYQHLLTGVSYMLPLVVAGGLMIALSFVFGIDAFKVPGTLAAALMQIGGGAAFKLMVPVLSGYIAYSIADRPGLTPGLVGGWLAAEGGAGFLGGIIAGFIAGYFYSEDERDDKVGSYKFLLIVFLCALVHNIIYFFFYFNWRIDLTRSGTSDDWRFALFIVFASINSIYVASWGT